MIEEEKLFLVGKECSWLQMSDMKNAMASLKSVANGNMVWYGSGRCEKEGGRRGAAGILSELSVIYFGLLN